MARINSRDKGIRGERQVIELLQPLVNKCFLLINKQPPTLQRNTMQCDGGGSAGNADIAGLEFLAIEVKNCATLALSDWWKQCVHAAESNNRRQEPILIYKYSRGTFRVRMFGCVGFSVTETRCVVDLAFEDFAQWFEKRLLEWLSESADLKAASPAPVKPAPVNFFIASDPDPTPQLWPSPEKVAKMAQRDLVALAVRYCEARGFPVPAPRTAERREMVDWVTNAALNGELEGAA